MSHHDTRIGPDHPGMDPDPNAHPHALSDADANAAAITCRFLGKTFYENDTICYQKEKWVCGPEGWSKTGSPC